MPGAYRTQTDLILETLKNLGVLTAGNAADPEDNAYVLEKVDPTIRLLAGLDICYIGDPNQIPGELFSPLADVMAGECSSKFGSTPDDRRALIAKGLGGADSGVPLGAGSGAQALRQINRGRPTYETQRTQSF
jgi:hypothetical protein